MNFPTESNRAYEDRENRHVQNLTLTYCTAGVLFLLMCFVSCDRQMARTADQRKTLPLVTTCITHSPVDSVRGGNAE